jgi:hypothetical protein
MKDYKTIISNFCFQLENTIDILRQTFLKCLATFLVWFSIILAIGIGILVTLKLFILWIL